MSMPKKVTVCEVCPRDGWQNHPMLISTDMKIQYIKRMVDCGAHKMEITSFVNPKYVPQMSDAREVFHGVRDYLDEKGVTAFALTLNKHGVEDARAAGFHHVEFVLSASEEHNLRNSRRTIQESLDAFKALAREANDLHIILAMPCIFGSPFGDEVPLDRIKWLIDEAESVGVAEFGVADTYVSKLKSDYPAVSCRRSGSIPTLTRYPSTCTIPTAWASQMSMWHWKRALP